MAKIRCKLTYHRKNNSVLGTFAGGVKTGIFQHNPPFNAPPMDELAFHGLIEDFNDTYSEYEEHRASIDEVMGKRNPLMNALDGYSEYVNTVANGDAIIIGLGGFEATKGSLSSKIAPVMPTGVTLERGIGELIAECDAIAGADSYGAILVANNPLPENIYINGLGQIVVENNGSDPLPPTPLMAAANGIVFIQDLTKSRKKKFSNLQAGVTYYVYFWAMNTGGVSPLSIAVSMKVLE